MEECRQVPRQECKAVPRQVCKDVAKQECRPVTRWVGERKEEERSDWFTPELEVSLAQALVCHKVPDRASKDPMGYPLSYAGSLWHKGAFNRSFQCTKANSSIRDISFKDPLCLWMPELVLYGIRELA